MWSRNEKCGVQTHVAILPEEILALALTPLICLVNLYE